LAQAQQGGGVEDSDIRPWGEITVSRHGV